MYTFTMKCPATNILSMDYRHNYTSANMLERQLLKAGVAYQVHFTQG